MSEDQVQSVAPEDQAEASVQAFTLYATVPVVVQAFQIEAIVNQKSEDEDSSVGTLYYLHGTKGEYVVTNREFMSTFSPSAGGYCLVNEGSAVAYASREAFESTYGMVQEV